MTTVKEMEVKLNGHEKECAVRYANIEKQLDQGNAKFDKLNTEDAKGNWFQSGWRPATGWICVAGFAVNFLISPLAAPLGITIPQADTTVMLPVLLGMLGLGGMRTAERMKGKGK